MLHILNGSFQDERKRVAFFCILGMSKALCGQRPSVWWSAGSSAPANLYAVWSVCSTRLDARSNFSLWGVIWWPKATDMMDVLNRIDSLFEYFIHIDSISILCQAELLQSWWVTQHFQGCSQFLVQIWCGHSKSRQKAWDLSTFLFFGILSCEHKNCTDKNVNSGITCHYSITILTPSFLSATLWSWAVTIDANMQALCTKATLKTSVQLRQISSGSACQLVNMRSFSIT